MKIISIRNSLIILFFVILLPGNGAAQVNPVPITPRFGISSYEDEPSWLLMVKGKQAFYQQDYGTALTLFREVIRKEGIYPDSEMWIGFIYEAEGNFDLALRQYNKALDIGSDFYVPEEKYLLYYRKASIYSHLGRKELMRQEYEALIQIAETPLPARMQAEMLNTVKNRGFDKAIELYRPRNAITLNARIELGAYYLDSGRTEAAFPHLFFAVMTPISLAIEELIKADPEYEFVQNPVPAQTQAAGVPLTDNFALFMEKVHRNERLSNYFKQVNFYKALYLFSQAMAVDPSGMRSAGQLFLLLSEWPQAESWRIRARAEL